MALRGILSKQRIYVGNDYNRWLLPPAALAIHLCIGMAYGFSVFWLPMSQAIGISEAIPCPANMTFFQSLFTEHCDWPINRLGWIYTLFFVFLGGSAAVFGRWLEHAGPRAAGFIAALCWGGSFYISALAIYLHQIWLLWLSSGVIGGIGLGLGYISPVSTLMKWFPDRRGMATGMAIMGFGGGALVGAPLANLLMNHFSTPTSVGLIPTFLVMGSIYLLFMLAGAFSYRLPLPGWKPKGMKPLKASKTLSNNNVSLDMAWKTPQFWLLWLVLCLNVTAGIGIIGMASPMLQEIFAGKLIHVDASFTQLTLAQKAEIASIAAGFTGLISLFNIAGRIVWASSSDYMGRKTTYALFFGLGGLLYSLIPWFSQSGFVLAFILSICLILSMYGGGFATIPAYLADLFGTQMVGAIHGRLITAWSVAGILGPVIVNYIREYELARRVPRQAIYDKTVYVLAFLLVIGFICNALIKPVNKKYYMSTKELNLERARAQEMGTSSKLSSLVKNKPVSSVRILLAWMAVLIPLVWGLFFTFKNTFVLFL